MNKSKLAVLVYAWTRAAEKGKGWLFLQMRVFDLITICFHSKLPLDFQLSNEEQAFAFVLWQLWSLPGKGLPNFLYLVFMRLASTVVPNCEYLFVLGRFCISASEFCISVSGGLVSVASQRNLTNGRNLLAAGQRWTSPPGAWWTHNNHRAVNQGSFFPKKKICRWWMGLAWYQSQVQGDSATAMQPGGLFASRERPACTFTPLTGLKGLGMVLYWQSNDVIEEGNASNDLVIRHP